jgi:hypothetical protein
MKNDLNQLLKILLQNDLPFVIIGGFAGTFHGSSQVTFDLEICMPFEPRHFDVLKNTLAPFHPVHRMTPDHRSLLKEPPTLSECKNLYIACDLGVLDVLSEVKGLDAFDALYERAEKMTLFAHVCRVLSIDDLIKAKEAMGREKDRITVKELKEIKRQTT